MSWILRLESRIPTKSTISHKKKYFLEILVLFGAKLSLTPRHLRETHRRMDGNGIVIRTVRKLLMNFKKKSSKNSQNFWSKKISKDRKIFKNIFEKSEKNRRKNRKFRFFQKVDFLIFPEKLYIFYFFRTLEMFSDQKFCVFLMIFKKKFTRIIRTVRITIPFATILRCVSLRWRGVRLSFAPKRN